MFDINNLPRAKKEDINEVYVNFSYSSTLPSPLQNEFNFHKATGLMTKWAIIGPEKNDYYRNNQTRKENE